jgi:Tol biopolymer transport system component
LFTVEPKGEKRVQISGDLTTGGDVTDFVWSPDSRFVAYRANQDNVINFELYVTTPDDSSNDTKVSGDSIAGGVDPIFEWSPDSTRVAYRANQRTADAIELFTATPDGEENRRVSGDLSSGDDGEEFKWAWAPDSSGIGYISDQENDGVFELFASTPNGDDEPATLSGSFAEDENGDVLFFEWVP